MAARFPSRLLAMALAFPLIVRTSTLDAQTTAPPEPAPHMLTLQDAIAMAQVRGPSAEVARSSRDEARWQSRAFSASLLPQVFLSGNAANLNRGINPITLPDGSTQFVSQAQNQSTLGVGIAQRIPFTGGTFTVQSEVSRIDLFGDQTGKYWQTTPVVVGLQQDLFKPRNLIWDQRENDLSTEVGERSYLEAREDVAAQAAAAFFDLYTAQMTLQNSASNVAVNDTLYTLNKGRYQVGKIGENDLLKSELALLRSRASADDARLARDRAEAALRRIIGYPVDQPFTIVTPDSIPVIDADADVAVREALKNSSTITQSQLQRVQSQRTLNEAKLSSRFNATLSASVGFNQTAPVFGEAYRSPMGKQDLVVGVDMPVMQWGQGHANVEAAKADLERVTTNNKIAHDQLAEDARFSALQLQQAQRNVLISAKADTVAEKGFDVAKNRYVIGKIGITDLYQAQTEKDAAVLAYVDALRGYWTAYYHLRRVTLFDFATKTELGDERK